MSEQENIEKIVRALRLVPPKTLRIVELLNEIPLIDGDLDADEVVKRANEVNSARAEAHAYSEATERVIRSVLEIL